MKKYASVPFLCKIKRFSRKVLNSGIRIKKNTEFSFSRDRDIVPDKKYSLGGEKFISVRSIIVALSAVIAAVCTAVLTARIVFLAAVHRTSKKKKK